MINAIAPKVPELWGGSADLAESNNSTIEGAPSFIPEDRSTAMWKGDPYAGRVLHFGIREHGMGSILNGIAVSGGTRVFGATFLTFSDYMRPSVRLAALMQLPVTYVWTHDSIGLGEDGPTHQPIEHLAALRAIPGLDVVRPADANETAACWQTILGHNDRPAGIILTRQNVPVFPRDEEGFSDTSNVHRGGYVLVDADGGLPDVVLVGTGSEVQLAVQAREILAQQGVRARVVSMPCREWFDAQEASYRETVIPPTVKARVSVEAGIAQGWREVVGDHGRIVSLEHYGASADFERIYREFGITAAGSRRGRGGQHQGGHRLTVIGPATARLDQRRRNNMADHLKELSEAGVSIWLDDLSRERLETGNLADLVRDDHVVGVTTNPSIFAAALSEGERYDEQVRQLAAEGADVDRTVFALTTTDVRNACDVLKPVFDATLGVDGRVSIEVAPDLAFDTDATLQSAKELWKEVDRENLFIKIPATTEALPRSPTPSVRASAST